MHIKCWLENLKGRDHSQDLGVSGRIILVWTLQKRVGGCRLDAFGSGYELVTSYCEHGNELPCSIKCGVFLEQLSDYQLLKDSAPCSQSASRFCHFAV